MKYQVIDDFKVKTAKSELELSIGQVISLSLGKATKLIEIGKIRPFHRPYVERCGTIVIPFDSEPKYQWWNGGQRLSETLVELNAPEAVKKNYLN